jgi:PDZ domain-containing protein
VRIRGRVLVAIVGGLLGLAAITFGVLYLIPSGDYILLPDRAHPVAPLVRVQGGHEPRGRGQIYFVDVLERRASELESLFPWLHDGATLVPAEALVPPGESDQAARQADLRAMQVSQQIGYHVVAKPSGVIVAEVEAGSNAERLLRPEDVIVGVNGRATPTIAKLRSILAPVRPGDVVTLRVRRGSQLTTVQVKTIPSPVEKGRAIVGFAPDQAANIKLPINVQIDAGNVGGPSAGLAFTLEVLAELGHDVTRGYNVAATGEIELNGTVAPIGGVRQKIFGVRAAGAQVFLVPAGDNAAVARRYAAGVRVIPVTSFEQALRALAKLPPKR